MRVVVSRTLISHKLGVKNLGFVPGQSFHITEYQLMKKINEIKLHYQLSTDAYTYYEKKKDVRNKFQNSKTPQNITFMKLLQFYTSGDEVLLNDF